MATREVVIVHRSVAEQFWHKTFDEVLAAAKSGAEGMRVDTQVSDFRGRWPIDEDMLADRSDEAILIRRGVGCELYQQGWTEPGFRAPYLIGHGL